MTRTMAYSGAQTATMLLALHEPVLHHHSLSSHPHTLPTMAVTTTNQAMAAQDDSAGQNIPPTTPTIKRTRPSSSSGSEDEEREAKRVKTSTKGKGKAVDRAAISDEATGSSHPNAIPPAVAPSLSPSRQPTAGDQDRAFASDSPASENSPILAPIDTSHPLIAAEITFRARRWRDHERPERRNWSRMQRRNVRRLYDSQQGCDGEYFIDETDGVDTWRRQVTSELSEGWNEHGQLILLDGEEEGGESDHSTVLEGSDHGSGAYKGMNGSQEDDAEDDDAEEDDTEEVERSSAR